MVLMFTPEAYYYRGYSQCRIYWHFTGVNMVVNIQRQTDVVNIRRQLNCADLVYPLLVRR